MNLDLNIYTLLVTKYEKTNDLPKQWNQIDDLKIKIELLSQALNKNKKIEELKIFELIIGVEKND